MNRVYGGMVAVGMCLTVAACGSSGPKPPDSASVAARGYLKAMRTEKGSRVCPLVTAATRKAYIDAARGEGGTENECESAADRELRGAGRVLRHVRIVRVSVRGDSARATVNDAAHSDSGDDTFNLTRRADGRWL